MVAAMTPFGHVRSNGHHWIPSRPGEGHVQASSVLAAASKGGRERLAETCNVVHSGACPIFHDKRVDACACDSAELLGQINLKLSVSRDISSRNKADFKVGRGTGLISAKCKCGAIAEMARDDRHGRGCRRSRSETRFVVRPDIKIIPLPIAETPGYYCGLGRRRSAVRYGRPGAHARDIVHAAF